MNSQEYIEVSIRIEPYTDENAEIMMAELAELPFESFTESSPYLKCYIPKEKYDPRLLKLFLSGLDYGFSVDFNATLMPQVNWNAVWESQFSPIVVDGLCTIKASFHKGLKRTRFNITIDPRMAFGTGHHQTTYMMCRALLRHEKGGGKPVRLRLNELANGGSCQCLLVDIPMENEVTQFVCTVEAPTAGVTLVGSYDYIWMRFVPINGKSIQSVCSERHHEHEDTVAFEQADHVVDGTFWHIPSFPYGCCSIFNHVVRYQQRVVWHLDIDGNVLGEI